MRPHRPPRGLRARPEEYLPAKPLLVRPRGAVSFFGECPTFSWPGPRRCARSSGSKGGTRHCGRAGGRLYCRRGPPGLPAGLTAGAAEWSQHDATVRICVRRVQRRVRAAAAVEQASSGLPELRIEVVAAAVLDVFGPRGGVEVVGAVRFGSVPGGSGRRRIRAGLQRREVPLLLVRTAARSVTGQPGVRFRRGRR